MIILLTDGEIHENARTPQAPIIKRIRRLFPDSPIHCCGKNPINYRSRKIKSFSFDTSKIGTCGVLSLLFKIHNYDSLTIIHGVSNYNDSAFTRLKPNSLIIDNGKPKKEDISLNMMDGKVIGLDYGLEHKWARIANFEGPYMEGLKDYVDDNQNRLSHEAINWLIENVGPMDAVCSSRIREI